MRKKMSDAEAFVWINQLIGYASDKMPKQEQIRLMEWTRKMVNEK